MKILDRVKGIILNPKNEWETIQQEQQGNMDLLIKFIIPLVLIPVICSFIGYGLIGRKYAFIGHVGSVSIGIRYAVLMLINTLVGIYVTAFVIDLLATSFQATKNFNNALRLVAYSYTPALIAGIFYIFPSLRVLAMLASLYGLYIMYIGIKPMMKAPDDKVTVYFIISIVVLIFVYAIVGTVVTSLLIRSAFSGIF
jgi:hypothetical protein